MYTSVVGKHGQLLILDILKMVKDYATLMITVTKNEVWASIYFSI